MTSMGGWAGQRAARGRFALQWIWLGLSRRSQPCDDWGRSIRRHKQRDPSLELEAGNQDPTSSAHQTIIGTSGNKR